MQDVWKENVFRHSKPQTVLRSFKAVLMASGHQNFTLHISQAIFSILTMNLEHESFNILLLLNYNDPKIVFRYY